MSKRAWPVLMIAAMVMSSCGSPSVTESTTMSTEIPLTPTTATQEETDHAAVEDYLVGLSNLAADLQDRVVDFECEYNEQIWPGSCNPPFEEEGQESEPPPEPSEQDFVEIHRGLLVGMFDLRLEHVAVLEAITPPPAFETAHRDFVDAYRDYHAHIRDEILAITTLSGFDFLYGADPLAGLPPDTLEFVSAYVAACDALVQKGAEVGYSADSLDLGCPSLPPIPVTIEVIAGEVWVAAPNPAAAGDGLVRMVITNTGTEAIRPVVVDISEGDPLKLPVVGGVVDLALGGVWEAGSEYASFNLHYSGHDQVFITEDGVQGQPPELAPGQSVEAAVWSGGTLVVFDYRAGEFEAGALVVIEREPDDGR
jgi:hypothetical protein